MEDINVDFFNILFEDKEFSSELGKLIMASGWLEAELIGYLTKKLDKPIKQKSTLGQLTNILVNNNLLTEIGEYHYRDLSEKRNYFSHNLYSLFNFLIEESELPSKKLFELDKYNFINKVRYLKEDFIAFAKDVSSTKTNKEYLK